jgi:hypothetical protein
MAYNIRMATNMPTLSTVSTMDETLSQITRARDATARLMATENISVLHDPSMHTATFDTVSRTLTLPVWKDCPSDVYDMLVAHEVGHALYTPGGAARLIDAIKFIDPRRPQFSKMLLNICEDARIERFVKNKYPGVGRNFAKGYEWMMNKDFFQLKGQSIPTLNLPDRVNLYFKPGLYGHVTIPFTAAEQAVVDQIAAANTFDQMVAAAKALYDLSQKQQQEQKQEQQYQQSQSQSGDGNGEANGGQNSNGNSQSSQQQGDGDGESNGNKSSDQNGEQQGSKPSNSGSKDQSGNADFGQKSTQDSMEQALRKMCEDNAMPISMTTIPEQDISKIIYPFKSIAADIAAFESEYASRCNNPKNPMDTVVGRGGITPDARLTQFTRENRAAILTMVRRFEMKMNADVARRTCESRSGTLNMSRIHSYKLIDDIFLTNSEVSAGKNHGVVFYLDWSSSMNGCLHNTVKQLLNMTEFCKALNIPFDVYAFTTNPIAAIGKGGDRWNSRTDDTIYPGLSKMPNGMSLGGCFGLLHFLSSSMNKNEYRTVAGWLLEFSAYQQGILKMDYRSHYYDALHTKLNHLSLDGTPLDNAVISAFKIVPQFKAKHNLQVVTCCVLTDGEAGGDCLNRQYSYRGNRHVSGKAIVTLNGKRYCTADGSARRSVTSWCFLMEVLKNAYGVNTMGIFLAVGGTARLTSHVEGYFEDSYGVSFKSNATHQAAFDAAVKMLKDEDFTVVPRAGFDKYLLIRADNEIVNATDALDSVDAGDARAAGNAFRKGMSKRLTSRNLLTVIADTCSTCVGI